MRSTVPPYDKEIVPGAYGNVNAESYSVLVVLTLLTEPFFLCVCVEFVFSLDATDEVLEERVLNLPESVAQGTSHSVEKYFPRLAAFRTNNSGDETVLKYFDELEIHPERIGRPQRQCHFGGYTVLKQGFVSSWFPAPSSKHQLREDVWEDHQVKLSFLVHSRDEQR